jgi:hypothetical protein
MPWRFMGSGYIIHIILSTAYFDVTDELHALAAMPLGKESPVPVE